MKTSLDAIRDLCAPSSPAQHWQPLLEPAFSADEWTLAVADAATLLPSAACSKSDDIPSLIAAVLGEGRFGSCHYSMSVSSRLYYTLKPVLPRPVVLPLRRLYRSAQQNRATLDWPIEDRYVRFQFRAIRNLMIQRGITELSFVDFWPGGSSFAFVLTHDVETAQGQRFVPQLADLEEQYGFRSSFNFVPRRYPLDRALMADLRDRGFEIGVHGLKHDGRLFLSKRGFDRRAGEINQALEDFGAVGFRAPLMHRNPRWMQRLDVEYDLSFFDTDPYEPQPGGTMSVWPFFIGRFVELPYTLAQDHTLLVILGRKSPRLWLQKIDFIERCRGMALLITHPDYLRQTEHLAVYERFLAAMAARNGYWHALPREVARWWRARAKAPAVIVDGKWRVAHLPNARIGQVSLSEDTISFDDRKEGA